MKSFKNKFNVSRDGDVVERADGANDDDTTRQGGKP